MFTAGLQSILILEKVSSGHRRWMWGMVGEVKLISLADLMGK